MKKISRDNEGQVGINVLSRSEVSSSLVLQGEEIQSQRINVQQEIEILLNQVKPLLKKNLYHQNCNVILMFKSIEIYFIEEDEDKTKMHSPIYVPPNCINELLSLSKNQLEIKIMENITYDQINNSFAYNKRSESKKQISPGKKVVQIKNKFEDKVSKSSKPQASVGANSDLLPEVIYSSMFIHAKNKDYKVIIKMPTIEYQILSKNFAFIKSLSRSELKEYVESAFQKWDDTLIKHLMSFSKFVELQRQYLGKQKSVMNGQSILINMPKKQLQQTNGDESDPQSAKVDVYILDEKNGINIIKYSSFSEYQQERIFKYQAQLKGCFERSGTIGRIQLKSFVLKIKSLSSEYEFKEQLKFESWKSIIGYMKKVISKNPDNPEQFVDLLGDAFTQSLEKNKRDAFSLRDVQDLKKYEDYAVSKKHKKEKSKMSSSKKKIPTNYFTFQKKSKIIIVQNKESQDRYLLELEWPKAQVHYEEQTIAKCIAEADSEQMILQKFQDWKRYLMNQLFRLELNISSNEPLPRINEVKREDEDLFSEEDFREKYPPKNEEEKQNIVETRDKLSLWFPY